MAKGINIPFNINGLREAKENLSELKKQIDATSDPKASRKLVKQYNDLSLAIDDTTDELIKLNKAGKLVGTRFDDLNEVLFETGDTVLPLTSQIGEMEDRMYQLSAAGDTTSDEFKALQAETVKLRKVIRDTDKSVDLLAENQGLSVFAEGWSQVGTSIMSLNFEQASKDATNLNNSIGNLGQIGASSLKNLGKTVGTLGKTFLQFGKALLLNPIFLLVGVIAAVVVGIIALLDYLGFLEPIMNAIGKAIGWVVQQFKDLLDWIGLTSFAEDERHEKIVKASKQKIEAIKKERKELENTSKKQKEVSDYRLSLYELEKRKAQGNFEAQRTAEEKIRAQNLQSIKDAKKTFLDKRQLDIDALVAHEKVLLSQARQEDAGNEAMKGSNRELGKQRAIISKRRKQLAEEDFLEVQKFEVQIQNVLLDTADAQKEINEAEKEQREERRARYLERKQLELDVSRQIEDLKLEQLKEGYDKEKTLTEIEYKRQREDVLANTEYTAEQKRLLVAELTNVENKMLLDMEAKRLEASQKLIDDAEAFKQNAENQALAELEAANEEIYQASLTQQQRDIEAVENKYDQLINLAEIYGEDTTALESERQRQLTEIADKETKKRIELERATQDAKLNLSKDVLSSISSATELFGKKNEKSAKRAFDINKAAQIGQAIISTYQGANAIFASAAANPSTVLFPAQPFIASGIAIANGLLNVAKISQTQFQGGSTGGGGGGGSVNTPNFGSTSVSSAVPSFELFGQSNDLNEVSASESAETTQNIEVVAVVSETEITNTQNNINNIKKSAEL